MTIHKFSSPSLLGGIVLLIMMFWLQSAHSQTPNTLKPMRVTPTISISKQILPSDIKTLKESGFTTVIDLRPDGEVASQPTSDQMSAAAQVAGLQFGYVPITPGQLPSDQAIENLARLLAQSPGPALLYCQSGRRAAHTWALMEASRPGGLDAQAISRAILDAGQNVSDISELIAARVAIRGTKH